METEDSLIEWLRQREAERGRCLIGDDAAVLPAGGPWITTMDTQIEGVHFFPGLDPAWIARRLLAVNLSDLAAMGATPAYAFLALSAPGTFDRRRFFDAFLDACESVQVQLAGGDLSSQERVTAVLTLIGHSPEKRVLRRSAARPGDDLWIGGTVGESALGFELLRRGARLDPDGSVQGLPEDGLSEDGPAPRSSASLSAAATATAERAVRRHILPTPQLELGAWLADRRSPVAAMDISDGLAKDLHRLCRASGVAADIRWQDLPDLAGRCELEPLLSRSWEALVLSGGEDYVLCFTLSSDEEPPPERFGARKIGTIKHGAGVFLRRGNDAPRAIDDRGWDHLARPDENLSSRPDENPSA